MYIASSETNPDAPYRKGLSFMMQRSVSTIIVTILDCCYSGAAKVSKGYEDAEAKFGTTAIHEKSRILEQGEENVFSLPVKLLKRHMD